MIGGLRKLMLRSVENHLFQEGYIIQKDKFDRELADLVSQAHSHPRPQSTEVSSDTPSSCHPMSASGCGNVETQKKKSAVGCRSLSLAHTPTPQSTKNPG